MLSKFLVSHFIKNHENINDNKVREAYGYLAGTIGIISNLILFLIKLFIGLMVKSIAVTADAFNNLSDALSSIITILGFKLAAKPADKEHPFGHGRIEYISGLIIAFMVMLVGFEFTKSSVNRIIHPGKINFHLVPLILILISILAKIWLSLFNKYIGKKINSSALEASSLDALSDVISSSTVALSLLLSKWISFPIDGYIGILVSLFILHSGFSLIKDTINPLLGEAPNPEFVKKLKSEILSYEHINDIHDLIIHNYGPGRCMASLHAEVPCDISIVKIHEIIDKAEKEVSKKLHVFLVIHMDPVNNNDDEIITTKNEVSNILKKFDEVKSFHDFRIVGEGQYKNLLFDVVIGFNCNFNEKDKENLVYDINKEIKKFHPNYNALVTIDREYV
ncbi:cation diffusion facilitator family transporter [Clostridium aestuarii]|uniref:Cation diffusion facilitator family transporter n=1 Tax=Clostridium aestuarii TaxID=338193 RepID=A0ABT4CW68_9CLOT|nr:cation diffusion facilitator family transporter [Clostridium aestuarii]MCY6483242.1 cation diffusion facilitator family transporter [Clostridium aestuarii]